MFDDSDSSEFKSKYLTIEVGECVLELLPMGDLPAKMVMELLNCKQSERLDKALALMKLAARDSDAHDREIGFMSFNELIVAIDIWMDRSSDNSETIRETLEKKKSKGTDGDIRKGFSAVEKKKSVELESEFDLPEGLADELTEMVEKALIERGIPVTHTDIDDEDPFDVLTDEEALEWFLEDIKKAGIVSSEEELTPLEAITIVAKFFVAHGREEMLIKRGLLTEGNRSGKFYPIIDGSVKRRMGFTKSEAKEHFKK